MSGPKWIQHKIPAMTKILVENGQHVRKGKILGIPAFGYKRSSIYSKKLPTASLKGVNRPMKAKVSGVVQIGDGIIWVVKLD